MSNLVTSFSFTINYSFKESISKDYLNYLTSHITKIRVNYVKQTIETWTAIDVDGPFHQILSWLIKQTPDITVLELSRLGNVERELKFPTCSAIDNQIIYDYSKNEILHSYLVWKFNTI